MHHSTCLLCGSSRLRTNWRYHEKELVKCRSCGFVFMSRIPTEEELRAYYIGYSYEQPHEVSPITIKRYHELLNRLEAYRTNSRLLDVGCGIGTFLEIARARGWQVFGTELSETAVQVCEAKGIQMSRTSGMGSLRPEHYSEPFDVVTSFEVIEHLNKPQAEMTAIAKVVRKGGLFYCTTPNFNSLERILTREKYIDIVYPEHLSYYTPRTLNRLVTTHGFAKRKLQSTGLSLSRIRASRSQQVTPSVMSGAGDQDLRGRIERRAHLRLVRSMANRLLSALGIGATIKGWWVRG